MPYYRFREVLDLTGATRSQLIYWTHEQVVQAATGGTGHHRMFGFGHLVEVRVAVLLAERGFALDALQGVLSALRRPLRQTPPPELVWIQPDATSARSVWTGSAAEFAAELEQPFGVIGAVGILIKLQQVIARLKEAAAR